MGLMTILMGAVLFVILVCSKQNGNSIEADHEALGKATGKEDLLTTTHRTQN